MKSAALLLLVALLSMRQSAYATDPYQERATFPQLPERITDTEFWDLHSQFSEAGGSFAADNFTSNEIGVAQVAAKLDVYGHRGGAYVGVGPEQNFTYIATIRPKIAFIVDIRRQAIIQHLMFKAIFELSGTRSDFIGMLFSIPHNSRPPVAPASSLSDIWAGFTGPGDSALFARNLAVVEGQLMKIHGFALTDADRASLAYVYGAFCSLGPDISYSGFNAGSTATPNATFLTLSMSSDTTGMRRGFLASEDDFQFVRQMHLRNLIIPVVGDFAGPKAIRSVGEYLRVRRTGVSAFYTSNVEQYLFTASDAWRQFYANVSTLPLDSASVFVRPSLRGTALRSMLMTRSEPPVDIALLAALLARDSALVSGKSGAVAGAVTDGVSGAPVAGATVAIALRAMTVTTDSRGRFILPALPAGDYTLGITQPGFTRLTVDIQLLSRTVLQMQLALFRQDSVVASRGTGSVSTQTVRFTSAPDDRAALCPIREFLAAWRAARITKYSDATECVL